MGRQSPGSFHQISSVCGRRSLAVVTVVWWWWWCAHVRVSQCSQRALSSSLLVRQADMAKRNKSFEGATTCYELSFRQRRGAKRVAPLHTLCARRDVDVHSIWAMVGGGRDPAGAPSEGFSVSGVSHAASSQSAGPGRSVGAQGEPEAANVRNRYGTSSAAVCSPAYG